MSIYDFSVTDTAGGEKRLADYRGKVLLIVNTATGCGFTPQYKGLQELYEKYRQRGFEILDFPCNQFLHQAPGTDAEIGSFCTLRYGTTFPRFAKCRVNGDDAIPLYRWLKAQKSGIGGGGIKWNFTKFLVDRNGAVAGRFAPATAPAALDAAIAKLLDEKEGA
jgi:glutathione peroxidase